MKIHKLIPITLFWILLPAGPFLCQTPQCVNVDKYEMRSGPCAEMKPIVVRRLLGRVIRLDQDGHVRSDVQNACLSLFTADSHTYVTSTSIDHNGHFDFGVVPAGRYRLVARAPGLVTGNSPVTVAPSPWRRHRRIQVVFTCCTIDACTGMGYDHK